MLQSLIEFVAWVGNDVHMAKNRGRGARVMTAAILYHSILPKQKHVDSVLKNSVRSENYIWT